MFVPNSASLRRGVLAGVCICVLTVAYSILRYPGIVALPAAPKFLPLFLAGVVWYGLAAVRWTQPTTREDFVVLHYGARWGIVIGLAWTVEAVAGDVFAPRSPGSSIGILAAIVAGILPVVAGATGASVTGRIWTGARVGFWTGVVSGLIAFVAVAMVGYAVPHDQDSLSELGSSYSAGDIATSRIADYLAGGVSRLFIVGALFCTAAGAFGGLFRRFVPNPRTDWLSY